MRIFTIGYEGATQGEFLAALEAAGVKRIIDVRAVPNSRRPGFSKTPLRNALAEAGIDYVHLRALGTPADGRAAARAGRLERGKELALRRPFIANGENAHGCHSGRWQTASIFSPSGSRTKAP